MTENEKEIQKLVQDLKPVVPMAHYFKVFLSWILLGIGVLTIVFPVLGIRPDFLKMLHHVDFWIELLVGAVLWIFGGFLGFKFSVPQREKPWLFLALGIPVLGWILTLFLRSGIGTGFQLDMHFQCGIVMFFVSFLPIVGFLWLLSKATPLSPIRAGLLAALSSAGFAAFTIKLICPSEAIWHLILWHFLPFLILSLLGLFLGKVFIKDYFSAPKK